MHQNSNASQERKYVLYDWYSDTQPLSETNLGGSIKDRLVFENNCWSETTQETAAELVIIIPDFETKPIGIKEALLFSNMLAGDNKRVLVVDNANTFQIPQEYWPEWFYCISSSTFDTNSFSGWIKTEWKPKNTIDDIDPQQLELSELKKFAIDILNISAAKAENFTQLLVDCYAYHLSKKGANLLEENNLAAFLYGLILICARYDSLEHDFNRLTMENALDENDFKNYFVKRAFMDFCKDLLDTLINYDALQKIRQNTSQSTVLLIDDNSSSIEEPLKEIITYFLKGYELKIWNPTSELKDSLQYYNSFGGRGKLFTEDTKFPVRSVNGNETEDISLKELLDETRFILVDILFKNDKGEDLPCGPQLIRSLKRLSKDYRGSQSNNQKNKNYILPTAIAISRADDLEKVQSALRSGAGGYILKSRLCKLPSVLSRNCSSRMETTDALHRAFRSLYALREDTIGLLRSTNLKPLPFHGVESPPDVTQEEKFMADLLRRLPKADLHVHAGSCMTPEFLIVASLIMLARHEVITQEDELTQNDNPIEIASLIAVWEGHIPFSFTDDFPINDEATNYWDIRSEIDGGDPPVEILANKIKELLLKKIEEYKKGSPFDGYRKLRSILHSSLKIEDYLTEDEVITRIETTQTMNLFMFLMTHGSQESSGEHSSVRLFIKDKDDVLRAYILWLAAKDGFKFKDISSLGINLLSIFSSHLLDQSNSEVFKHTWNLLKEKYHSNTTVSEAFDKSNWALKPEKITGFVQWKDGFTITREPDPDTTHDQSNFELLQSAPNEFQSSRLVWSIATGQNCSNLKTYLQGCEYTGAEHLRHPFLIHLYAQQTVYEFVKQGVLYAELRASPQGYENKNLEFTFRVQDATRCLQTAFSQAQETIFNAYKEPSDENGLWLLNQVWNIKRFFPSLKQNQLFFPYFPVKVGILLGGKRHKSTKQMIREISSSIVLQTSEIPQRMTASKFAEEHLKTSRLVGFDLSGQESEEYAPSRFKSEFEHLAKFHIPITVHAGENASVQFIEDAILDLRASRIGHGLVLIDDQKLMDRARENRVCIELCPVSNYQTNQFYPKLGRQYPLRKLLENGNPVCINTDNPVISFTNIIKEYFQASYAFGDSGLSLWEILRLIRAGFVHSFMGLPERKSILELADQIIFDLFTKDEVIEILKILIPQSPAEERNN